ncbi:DUF5789 family protein [Natronobacterium texcoconense]|uniref:DUF2795 domain-containing protein n=1 Tax=Natronobacterium texcoconense TaxID=1095778 RepID=A0A1H0ZWH4_NATTX|nr:hypothetical protein [Natronobacterium texcoconense]SDQ31416.1 hypothetical protein SAMN04489842_0451 [Natronobacterium texcoconense]
MTREVNLSRVEETLKELDYPATNDEAADEFADVTLLLADGERNLGSLVEKSRRDRFDSVDDLKTALHNVLPREAVGEPYQSEGEG